jgi:hypothetical protein
VQTYRKWFQQAGFTIEAEGSEPRNGNPGYAVLIGRRDEPGSGVGPGSCPSRTERANGPSRGGARSGR